MPRIAEPEDMTLRYDARVIGDLVSDRGSRVNPEELAADPVLLTSLEDATGEILAYLYPGERYTENDLTQLLGGESLSYLKSLCCQVAWVNLLKRKPTSDQYARQIQPARESYLKALEELRKGIATLDLSAQKAAGQAFADTISRATVSRWNLYSNRGDGRFYPPRRTTDNR